MHRLVESVRHIASRNKVAIDVIRPAVVWTGEFIGMTFGLKTNERAAMPAHVCKRLQVAVFSPHDNCRLPCNVENLEIARLRKLRNMTRKNPVAINDFVNLKFVYLRIRIKTLIQLIAGLLTRDQFRN